MGKLKVLAVTEARDKWLQAFVEQYEKKISAFADFEVVKIKPYKEARGISQIKNKREAESVLKKISDKDYVLICDERGKALTSLEFSKKIESLSEQLGSKDVVFVVGGAYGLAEEILERAEEKIQLSKFVMNHHLALAVLLEQIYRGYTIIRSLPYHN